MKVEEVAIIGAGPAGIAAAIQLRRQGLNPVIFEREAIGGLLRNANLVENYPGFPGGIPGGALVTLFDKQLADHAVRLIYEEIIRLDFANDQFEIKTGKCQYFARTVMIASGTRPRPFTDVGIPDEILPLVHYEIFSILNEKGRKIIIVGAGDAAFDYALNLQRHNEVTILNRGDRTRCLPLLEQRAFETKSIDYRTRAQITKIDKNPGGGLRIECMTPDRTESLKADYLIFAIGRDLRLDFLSDRIQAERPRLEESGRLYFIGDVKNEKYRQTAIAVGDAIMAAMKIGRRRREDD